MIKDEIENKLNDDLNPWFLDVINESPNHNVPDGAESHFKIVIVSEKFLDFRAVTVSYTHLTLPTTPYV